MSGDANELWNLIAIRPAKESDYSFIQSHWVNGLRGGSDWYKAIPEKLYFTIYKQVVRRLTTDPGSFTLVACLKDDPDALVGFSVGKIIQGDSPTLHYVYVKTKWRHNGIGRALVPDGIVQFTHLTKMGRTIHRKHQNLIFNPFAL